MPRRKTHVIVASSGGIDAKGAHIITPDSVISYVDTDDKELKISQTLASGPVSIKINPIWTHELLDVTLPVQRLYEHIPISPALIKRFIENTNEKFGGLMFPGDCLDTDSKDPRLIISKNSAQSRVKSDCIQVKIKIYLFRREIDPSPALQPFDPAVWHPNARAAWEYAHTELAPMYEEECDAMQSPKFPRNACTLFRRMMRTHFDDCSIIFGKRVWCEFGLGEMVDDQNFMRNMLVQMFRAYFHDRQPETPSLPPMFNAVAKVSGQRICAFCLCAKVGTGQMGRCPCHQVYYCSTLCRDADWKVHRLVCGKGRKK